MVVTGILGEKLAIEELRECVPSVKWEELLNDKNIKDYDIFGLGNKGNSIKVQIKTVKGGDWSLNMQTFLKFDKRKLTLKEPEQWVVGVKEDLKKKVDFFIFVYLQGFSEKEPQLIKNGIFIEFSSFETDFYIIDTTNLQKILKKNYSQWLISKNHKRPKNPLSFHSGLLRKDLEIYKDKWEIIR